MDPITLSLLISAGPAIFQGIQGIKQTQQGKEMQKNLGARVNYEIPEEAKKALALAQGLASSREMPGQAGMQAMMDLQAQKAFGNASRAAMSSQDLLGVATNLGEQAQENQLNLGIQAAQNYQQRQQALQQALGTMAGYQEKKTADRQQDWYERAQAAAAMRGAGMENTMGAVQGISQALMQAIPKVPIPPDLPPDSSSGGGPVSDSFTKSSDLPTSIDHTNMSGKNLMKLMMQNKQVSPPPVAEGQAQFGKTWQNLNSALQFQQNPNYSPGMFNPTSGAIFPMQSMTSFGVTGAPRGLMPTTSFKDVMNLYNTFY